MGGWPPLRRRSHPLVSVLDPTRIGLRLQNLAGASPDGGGRPSRLSDHSLLAPRRRLSRRPHFQAVRRPRGRSRDGGRGGGRGIRPQEEPEGGPRRRSGCGQLHGRPVNGGGEDSEAAAARVDPAAAQAVRGCGGAPRAEERRAEDDYAADERGGFDQGECGQPSAEIQAVCEEDAGVVQRGAIALRSSVCFHATAASELQRVVQRWAQPWEWNCQRKP